MQHGGGRGTGAAEKCGIGVELTRDPMASEFFMVKRLEPFGAAAVQGGVRPGDRLLFVDGQSMQGATPEQLRAALRGPRGTAVKVTVQLPNRDTTHTASITRQPRADGPAQSNGPVADATSDVRRASMSGPRNWGADVSHGGEDHHRHTLSGGSLPVPGAGAEAGSQPFLNSSTSSLGQSGIVPTIAAAVPVENRPLRPTNQDGPSRFGDWSGSSAMLPDDPAAAPAPQKQLSAPTTPVMVPPAQQASASPGQPVNSSMQEEEAAAQAARALLAQQAQLRQHHAQQAELLRQQHALQQLFIQQQAQQQAMQQQAALAAAAANQQQQQYAMAGPVSSPAPSAAAGSMLPGDLRSGQMASLASQQARLSSGMTSSLPSVAGAGQASWSPPPRVGQAGRTQQVAMESTTSAPSPRVNTRTAIRKPAVEQPNITSHSQVEIERLPGTGKGNEDEEALSGEEGLLFWNDIPLNGGTESGFSSLGRLVAHSMVALFMLFVVMKLKGDPSAQNWPIRGATDGIKDSWWWVFTPLFVLDGTWFLTVPSFFTTVRRTGLVVAFRRGGQRSGVVALTLFGNPFLAVSEILAATIFSGDMDAGDHTALIIVSPLLLFGMVVVCLSTMALLSEKSRTMRAAGHICTMAFFFLATQVFFILQSDGHISWPWPAALSPLICMAVLWLLFSLQALRRRVSREINTAVPVVSNSAPASCQQLLPAGVHECMDDEDVELPLPAFARTAVSTMLAVDGLGFFGCMCLLAAHLHGLADVPISLVPVPAYMSAGVVILWWIGEAYTSPTCCTNNFVLSDRQAILHKHDGDNLGPPMPGTAFRGELFTSDTHGSVLMRTIVPILLAGQAFFLTVRLDVFPFTGGYWNSTMHDFITDSWYFTLLPLFAIDVLWLLYIPAIGSTSAVHGPAATIRRCLQRQGFLMVAAWGNPASALSHVLIAESLNSSRGSLLLNPPSLVLAALSVMFFLSGVVSFSLALTNNGIRIKSWRWAAFSVCGVGIVWLLALRAYNTVTTWYFGMLPAFAMFTLGLVIEAFDAYSHIRLFSFGLPKSLSAVVHHGCLLAAAICISLKLEGDVEWQWGFTLLPIYILGALFTVAWFVSALASPGHVDSIGAQSADGLLRVGWSTVSRSWAFGLPIRYILDIRQDKDGQWRRVYVGPETSIEIDGLPYARSFLCRVATQDPTGACSTFTLSNSVIIKPRLPSQPAPPRVLRFIRQFRTDSSGGRQYGIKYHALVQWGAESDVPDVEYALEAAPNDADAHVWKTVYQGPALEARIPYILPGTVFRCRVTSRTEHGSSAPSLPMLFTAPSRPEDAQDGVSVASEEDMDASLAQPMANSLQGSGQNVAIASTGGSPLLSSMNANVTAANGAQLITAGQGISPMLSNAIQGKIQEQQTLLNQLSPQQLMALQAAQSMQ